MLKSSSLSTVILIIMLAGCTSVAGVQKANEVQSLPVTTNDYYQLVVDPGTTRTSTASFDCRRPASSSANGLPAAMRDFWLNMRNRDILTAITVEYTAGSQPVKDTFPVFTLRSRNQGKKCSPGINDIDYVSPLFLTESDDNMRFAITANVEDKEYIDSSILDGAKKAVSELAEYAGAPEPVAKMLSAGARDQLQKLTSNSLTPGESGDVGLRGPTERKFTLIEVETRSGKLTADAVAKFKYTGSALKPMTDRVPNLGVIGPRAPLRWKIGNSWLTDAVNAATENGWQAYQAASEPVKLNAICNDVQVRLKAGGYSSADASALAWIMVSTHPDAAAVSAMRSPACLTGPDQAPELARFGIVLPTATQPTAADAETSLRADGGLFRRFFATKSEIELKSFGERLFSYDTASPTTEDVGGQIFLPGTKLIPTAQSWEAYFPQRPIKLQCLTVVEDAAFGGVTAFAIAQTAEGKELPLAANFASLLPGSGIRISKIKVLDDLEQEPAYAHIRARWTASGRCEMADFKPQVIFGASATSAPVATPPGAG